MRGNSTFDPFAFIEPQHHNHKRLGQGQFSHLVAPRRLTVCALPACEVYVI